VDETGTNAAMTPLYSRSLVGERAVGKAPKNQGTNLTVVGAIALDGIRAMMAYEGGTTNQAFLHFVRHALVPALKHGDLVVWDNLKAHYANGVREAIEAVGAHVVFLPPYSPELNPIEPMWSKLKSLLRREEARTLRTLALALGRSSTAITPSDLVGWFTHCGYEAQGN
jgi:transposase